MMNRLIVEPTDLACQPKENFNPTYDPSGAITIAQLTNELANN
jgi:hypothetical protein